MCARRRNTSPWHTKSAPRCGKAIMMRRLAPVLVVLAILTALWYAAALAMNWDQAQALADDDAGWIDVASAALALDRPLLPTPDQVVGEMIRGVFGYNVASPRNLLFHAGVTAWAA